MRPCRFLEEDDHLRTGYELLQPFRHLDQPALLQLGVRSTGGCPALGTSTLGNPPAPRVSRRSSLRSVSAARVGHGRRCGYPGGGAWLELALVLFTSQGAVATGHPATARLGSEDVRLFDEALQALLRAEVVHDIGVFGLQLAINLCERPSADRVTRAGSNLVHTVLHRTMRTEQAELLLVACANRLCWTPATLQSTSWAMSTATGANSKPCLPPQACCATETAGPAVTPPWCCSATSSTGAPDGVGVLDLVTSIKARLETTAATFTPYSVIMRSCCSPRVVSEHAPAAGRVASSRGIGWPMAGLPRIWSACQPCMRGSCGLHGPVRNRLYSLRPASRALPYRHEREQVDGRVPVS